MSKLERSNFDLAILDDTIRCPLIRYMKLPHIVLSAVMFQPFWSSLQHRTPFNPSYIPEFTTSHDHKMSFMERLKNTAFCVFYSVVFSVLDNQYKELLEEYNIADKRIKNRADAEMWLFNSDFVLDFPKPTFPNMAMVGGLTVRPASKLSNVSAILNMKTSDQLKVFVMETRYFHAVRR